MEPDRTPQPTAMTDATSMTDHDPLFDALVEKPSADGVRVARDALARSADGRRLLAVHDALQVPPPAPDDVPNLVPAVMARIAASAQRHAVAPPREDWRALLAGWLARPSLSPGPVLAIGALAAVVLLAAVIDQGPLRSGGLMGAAVVSAATIWTTLAVIVVAVLAVVWWLRHR